MTIDLGHLTIRDLQAVAAVAAEGHFGRAAAALRIAQPTLSAQVQKVERGLGAQLFERSGRRFLITEAGRRLLPLVRQALVSAERLREEAETGNAGGRLRLGVIPTLGPYLMPHLLLPLRRAGLGRGLGLDLAITELPTARLVEEILGGTLDAGLLSLPHGHEALEDVPLFAEAFRLIAPRGSRILECDPLGPRRMAAGEMVLLEEGHCLREQALSLCGRRGGAAPRLVTTSLETLKYLVASGEGYSLLPALASGLPKGLEALVELRDFDEGAPERVIGLSFRRSLAAREGVERLAGFMRKHPPKGVRVVRGKEA